MIRYAIIEYAQLDLALENSFHFLASKSVSIGKKKKILLNEAIAKLKNSSFSFIVTSLCSIIPNSWFIKNTTIRSQIRAIL